MNDKKHFPGMWGVALVAGLALAVGAVLLSYLGYASPIFGNGGSEDARAMAARVVDASGMPARREDDSGASTKQAARRVASMATIYDRSRPLGEQLPSLRNFARAGNSYAICILAVALDTCMQDAMQAYEMRLEELASEASIEAGDEDAVEMMSAEVEKRRSTEAMCRDVNELDTLERDEWMRLSARNGDPRSMALYARNPVANGNVRLDDIDRLAEYKKGGESMLNDAARAGIPEAIIGVHMAYLNGQIETPVGEIEVRKDAAKALGSAMVALEFSSGQSKIDLQKNIDEMVATIDDQGRARAASIRKMYLDAYRSRSAGRNAGSSAADTPDSICSRK